MWNPTQIKAQPNSQPHSAKSLRKLHSTSAGWFNDYIRPRVENITLHPTIMTETTAQQQCTESMENLQQHHKNQNFLDRLLAITQRAEVIVVHAYTEFRNIVAKSARRLHNMIRIK